MALIDIEELERATRLFRGRAGNSLARGLMNMLGITGIQQAYDRCEDCQKADFAGKILKDFGVSYEIFGRDILDNLPEGPFITVSNHTYGALDGLMLIDIFGHVRDDFKVMVNKILGRVHALGDSLITVTPKTDGDSAPAEDNLAGVKASLAHLRGGRPMGFFPSGAVSDLSLRDGCIRDREWQEPVLRLIRKAAVPIVPVRFFDRNSNFFFLLGLIDWRIRLLRLPREVLNKRGRVEKIGIGQVISVEEQASCKDISDFGKLLRDSVYSMSTPERSDDPPRHCEEVQRTDVAISS